MSAVFVPRVSSYYDGTKVRPSITFRQKQAYDDRHMYDEGGVSSFDSHFANISDRHEISTLINIT